LSPPVVWEGGGSKKWTIISAWHRHKAAHKHPPSRESTAFPLLIGVRQRRFGPTRRDLVTDPRATVGHQKKERCARQRAGFRQRNCVSRRKEVQLTSLRRLPGAGPHIRPRAATNRLRPGMGAHRSASQYGRLL